MQRGGLVDRMATLAANTTVPLLDWAAPDDRPRPVTVLLWLPYALYESGAPAAAQVDDAQFDIALDGVGVNRLAGTLSALPLWDRFSSHGIARTVVCSSLRVSARGGVSVPAGGLRVRAALAEFAYPAGDVMTLGATGQGSGYVNVPRFMTEFRVLAAAGSDPDQQGTMPGVAFGDLTGALIVHNVESADNLSDWTPLPAQAAILSVDAGSAVDPDLSAIVVGFRR